MKLKKIIIKGLIFLIFIRLAMPPNLAGKMIGLGYSTKYKCV